MTQKFPSIFLDTNVLWADNGKDPFKNKYIKGLKVYKDLTAAKIYTSEAFELELYHQETQRIKTISESLEKIAIRYPAYDFPVLNAIEIITTYQKQIRSFFSKIIPVNEISIRECIRRSVEKIAPCTQDKEEFRDTVGWLSYLRILQSKEKCIFISKDKHFKGCKSDHEDVKIYQTLHDFFQEFNEEFLEIKVSESDFFKEFPLSEIQQYLQYNSVDGEEIRLFVDESGTDFEVKSANNIEHISTDIVCTNYEKGVYNFSFTVGFICEFEIYNDLGQEITESYLADNGVYEEINGEFIFKDGAIEIDKSSISSRIEKESLSDILESNLADHYADQYSDLFRGR